MYYYKIFIIAILLIISQGCQKEPDRIDNYLVDFATLLKEGSIYRFKLDNGRTLIPQKEVSLSVSEGNRVIINWTPLDGDTVKVNKVSPIFTDTIHTVGYPAIYRDDPVKIVSLWVGDIWLNLIIEIEYHSINHSIRLFRDMESEEVTLYLSHSTNNDPPGYSEKIYASFQLSSLRKDEEELETAFKLFINTNSGMREFNLILK